MLLQISSTCAAIVCCSFSVPVRNAFRSIDGIAGALPESLFDRIIEYKLIHVLCRFAEIVVNDGKVLHLGLAKGQLAENVFLVGDPGRALRAAKRFDAILCDVRNREYVTITGTYNGTPVSVIGTGIGVDNVEIALVEAYATHAFDFDNSE